MISSRIWRVYTVNTILPHFNESVIITVLSAPNFFAEVPKTGWSISTYRKRRADHVRWSYISKWKHNTVLIHLPTSIFPRQLPRTCFRRQCCFYEKFMEVTFHSSKSHERQQWIDAIHYCHDNESICHSLPLP